MAIPVKADTLENIDEAYHTLYTKQEDDTYLLTEVDGMKTQEDIDRIQEGLRKERKDHKDTKAKLKDYDGIESEGLKEKLDKLEDLESTFDENGNITDEKLEELVDKRATSRVSKVQRELDKAKEKITEHEGTISGLQRDNSNRLVNESINSALNQSEGFVTTARDDALLIGRNLFHVEEDGTVVAKDDSGLTAGTTPKEWLAGVKDTRPHWWGDSQGGGSRPGNQQQQQAKNPWTKDNWNVTEQNRIYKEDASKAERLAAQANSRLGASAPPK